MSKPRRCQWRGINRHPTRDAIQFSDRVVEHSAVATFRNGHNVTCRCMAEEGCKPEDCDALYVTDENGAHLATLQGSSLRARQLQNGAMAIYRASVKTSDAKPTMTQAMMNERNEEYWKPKEETCQQ